ncbi:MAG: methyltransferase domain-containing protein [Magnetococcus sp. DMHC-1]
MYAVDWSSYADVYDLIQAYNPSYQDIITRFRNEVVNWEINPGDVILEIGAGTGNFSIVAAEIHPYARIIHIDSDKRMNNLAEQKIRNKNINNIEIVSGQIENQDWSKFKNIKAVVAIHSLYAMPEPECIMNRAFDTLVPGGYAIFCDLGRKLNIGKWSRYFARNLVKQVGLIETIRLFWRGRNAIQQNRRVRKMQDKGVYWLHSTSDFINSVSGCGFSVKSYSVVFLGYSDFVCARKQAAIVGKISC